MARVQIAAFTGVALLRFQLCLGHGLLTLPESNRQNGLLAKAGSCEDGECLWFSDAVTIPGEPTLNAAPLRTFNVHATEGQEDWSRQNPWRAPGSAPVFGSGCGMAGGGNVTRDERAAYPPQGRPQGFDGAELPAQEPTVWRTGGVEEVAWAITANHGGGYSYRLCPKGDLPVSEDCFQKHALRFAGDKHWIQYGDMTLANGSVLVVPRLELPLVRVTEGTQPPGSEWARNPIPSCLICSQAVCAQGDIGCAQACSGDGLVACPPGMTQFPEPLPGLSGFVPTWSNHIERNLGWGSFPFSILDEVLIPEELVPGDYLLSWRWDCEQSSQVWQNCADIRIVNGSHSADGSRDSSTEQQDGPGDPLIP